MKRCLFQIRQEERDEYWKCLNESKSKEDGNRKCKQLRDLFVKECPHQWVGFFFEIFSLISLNSNHLKSHFFNFFIITPQKIDHFDRKYDFLKYKSRIEKDGFTKFEDEIE